MKHRPSEQEKREVLDAVFAPLKPESEAALAAPARSEAWRPIATAPKDGTRVLLWCGEEIEVGYWSLTGWAGTPSERGAWIIYEARIDTIELHPTYWQPLPLPPNAESSYRSAPAAASNKPAAQSSTTQDSNRSKKI